MDAATVRNLIVGPRPGWTGGQYSIVRCVLGVIVAVTAVRSTFAAIGDADFDSRIPHWLIACLAILATIGGLLIAVGWRDRIASIVTMVCLIAMVLGAPEQYGVMQFMLAPAALILHVMTPAAPYGSVDAAGREELARDWTLPRSVWMLAWIIVIAAMGWCEIELANRAEPSREVAAWLVRSMAGCALVAAFLSVWPRTRKWAWVTFVLLFITLMTAAPTASPGGGLIPIILLTANPAWIDPKSSGAKETLYYDGTCGLCHRAVRFVLAEDHAGAFQFSPLQGKSIQQRLSETQRASLPDSIVVVTADGRILTRSAAVMHVLARLGGMWRVLGALAGVLPRSVFDWQYDRIASVRLRIFRRPDDACPAIAEQWRSRFLP